MTAYEIIFESLQNQLNQGLITYELAEEVNDLAYEKYVIESTAASRHGVADAVYAHDIGKSAARLNSFGSSPTLAAKYAIIGHDAKKNYKNRYNIDDNPSRVDSKELSIKRAKNNNDRKDAIKRNILDGVDYDGDREDLLRKRARRNASDTTNKKKFERNQKLNKINKSIDNRLTKHGSEIRKAAKERIGQVL